MRANLIFDSVKVKAKKSGKGVTKSTPAITDTDMIKLENTLMWTMLQHLIPGFYVIQYSFLLCISSAEGVKRTYMI